MRFDTWPSVGVSNGHCIFSTIGAPSAHPTLTPIMLANAPGIHNLGFAVLDDAGSIVDWRLVDLVRKKKPTIAELVIGAVTFVQELECDRAVVRIEQQPVNNTQMKVLSHVLQGLFLAKHCHVALVNPKTYKLSGGSYTQRKKDAVRRVTEIVHADTRWGPVFHTSTKKDDLADALLLAMWTDGAE